MSLDLTALARYRKWLVTLANLLGLVIAANVLTGRALAVAVGALALLTSFGVRQATNEDPVVELPDDGSGDLVPHARPLPGPGA